MSIALTRRVLGVEPGASALELCEVVCHGTRTCWTGAAIPPSVREHGHRRAAPAKERTEPHLPSRQSFPMSESYQLEWWGVGLMHIAPQQDTNRNREWNE